MQKDNMRSLKPLSRRQFVTYAALAAGAVDLTLPSTGLADDKPGPNRDPDAVLARAWHPAHYFPESRDWLFHEHYVW
jgi:hypothetical protein